MDFDNGNNLNTSTKSEITLHSNMLEDIPLFVKSIFESNHPHVKYVKCDVKQQRIKIIESKPHIE